MVDMGITSIQYIQHPNGNAMIHEHELFVCGVSRLFTSPEEQKQRCPQGDRHLIRAISFFTPHPPTSFSLAYFKLAQHGQLFPVSSRRLIAVSRAPTLSISADCRLPTPGLSGSPRAHLSEVSPSEDDPVFARGSCQASEASDHEEKPLVECFGQADERKKRDGTKLTLSEEKKTRT
ncbi:hypothetical protein RRG08_003031 [Elysia crispata]|uniref:Uncharacterized protein n=1 Tax=Elysia crispata TaxID=231223 RepID=A0AAE1EAN9_9GAST|nr:hypothetical protein RRG08_003031 [Elysia crispata]